MTYPTDALPDADAAPRCDWPVTLYTGAEVPFDVLMATWGILRLLEFNARAELLRVFTFGPKGFQTRGARALFEGLGLLDHRGHLVPNVRRIVEASVQPEVVNGQRVMSLNWASPAEGLAS